MTQGNDAPVKGADVRSPHVRRTIEQVKRKWNLGDYTASGYLVELFAAMKKEGWTITIPSVATFCQEWDIGERRFYRAKAKLINQGRLEERIKGTLEVWLTASDKIVSLTDETVSEDDDRVSEGDKIVSQGDVTVRADDTAVSATHLKGTQEARSQVSPDLSQISFNSSSNLSHSHPPNTPERELLNEAGEPIAAYREWLLRRAQELPKPPALLEVWIEKQASKKANQKAFLKFQSTRVEADVPPSPTEANFEAETLEQRLRRYQTMWTTPTCRRGIKVAIAAHPEWGLTIGKDGPEVMSNGAS